MKTIIFDIDGTLANISHRRHFVTGKKKDWVSFNNHMLDDVPNGPILELYNSLYINPMYNVILVSGRTDSYRELTTKWLDKYSIPFTEIIMRKKNDYRADNVIKEEILKELLSKGHKILFVVDDRDSVVEMWRKNGITCLQCDYGNF